MDHILFIHPSIDGQLGCFHFWNSAAVKIHTQGFVWTYVCISLGYIPWNGIAGSCGESTFNLPRTWVLLCVGILSLSGRWDSSVLLPPCRGSTLTAAGSMVGHTQLRIHSSDDGHWGLQFGAIMKSAALNVPYLTFGDTNISLGIQLTADWAGN